MNKIIKEILVLLSFLFLGYLVTGSASALSQILIPIYGLTLVKRKDNLGIKTVLWFQIVIVPAVILIPYLVKLVS
jgi:hypothetical protein